LVRNGLRGDRAASFMVFVAAAIVGTAYCAAFERTHSAPEPWAREMGAALAFACGRGFADPGYSPTPAAAAFLEKRIDRISCDADLPDGVPVRPLNFTQALYRYMTLAVGITWRAFGVSWTRLSILMGVLYAFNGVAIYALFRLAVPRFPALVGAAMLIASPLQLRYLPQLRDYAKAPFLLTLVLILAVLVVQPFTRARLLSLAVAYGAVVGVGFGFRNDLLIALAPFVLTVAIFLPVPVRAHVGVRAAALTLCLVAFAACAWPIIASYRGGSNTGHVAILGLMTPFDAPLGVTRPIYDLGTTYDDGLAKKIVTSYGQQAHGRAPVTLSTDYDRAALEYLTQVLRHWPADVWIRAYASVRRVLNLPFDVRRYMAATPPALAGGMFQRGYEAWAGIAGHFSGAGTLLAGAAVVAVAGWSVRVAVWLSLSLLYFGGYPALQFEARHFFFLEVIPWLAGISLAVWLARLRPIAVEWRSVRAITFAAAAAVALALPLFIARAYQQHHLTNLFERYEQARAEPVSLSPVSLPEGRVRLRPGIAIPNEADVYAEYLVLDISSRACRRREVPITLRYVAQPGYTDLSRVVDVVVPPSGKPFRLFFPAYYTAGAYFDGVEIPDDDRGCVEQLSRITDRGRTPLMLNLQLAPDWREQHLYQTLDPAASRFRFRG
jgi:hypothetical protein